jgi:hypothetical protein
MSLFLYRTPETFDRDLVSCSAMRRTPQLVTDKATWAANDPKRYWASSGRSYGARVTPSGGILYYRITMTE